MTKTQITLYKTVLSPREVKEGLEFLLPFSGKNYPKAQGISTKELDDKILFDFDNGYLAFTDCIRLALYPLHQINIDLDSTNLKGQYLISIGYARQLKSSLKKRDKTVPITIADNCISFTTSKGELSADIYNTAFPPYMDNLINDWADAKTISLNREEFIKAIEDVNPEEDIVTLKFVSDSNTMSVSETRSDYTETAPSVSSVNYQHLSESSFSEERKIALYSKYSVELLNKLKSEYVTLSFKDINNVGEQNWMLCPIRFMEGQFMVYMAPIKLNYNESNSC